eukprot:m.336229 g.336229  ORF g.336229 m.336229 type:complete len:129 (+) comp17789_c0_seq1:141-527(+)
MPSMLGMCLLSFTFTIGVLMVILGCALPEYGNFYPMFVFITYILAPLPTTIAKSCTQTDTLTGPSGDIAVFCTSALVCSGYGIPFVLWHGGIIAVGAFWLVASGNTIMFLSILTYFVYFTGYDSYGAF